MIPLGEICSEVSTKPHFLNSPIQLIQWGQRLHDIWKNRRKFRSQTSDNMDTWKNRGGKSQRREEKRTEEKRREEKRREEKRKEERRPEKRKEERRPEKRKIQKKENVGAQKGDGENACLCGTKHISKSNVLITDGSDHSWKLGCGFAWHAHGIRYLAKSGQNVRVCSSFQNVGRREQLNRICKDASRVAGAVQETYSSEMLGGPGAGFLRGVRQIFRFAKKILRGS